MAGGSGPDTTPLTYREEAMVLGQCISGHSSPSQLLGSGSTPTDGRTTIVPPGVAGIVFPVILRRFEIE